MFSSGVLKLGMVWYRDKEGKTFQLKFWSGVKPLPDDKILGLSKLKAFADDKSNTEVVFHRIENIAGKEENAGYQHFLLFPQCFQKAFSSGASKVVIVW